MVAFSESRECSGKHLGAQVIAGESGIGKSSLLRAAGCGLRAAVRPPCGGRLHQLLRPVANGRPVTRCPCGGLGRLGHLGTGLLAPAHHRLRRPQPPPAAPERTDLSDLDRAREERLREIFEDGRPGDAARVLVLCAVAERSVTAGDHDLALNLLLGAALRRPAPPCAACGAAGAGRGKRSPAPPPTRAEPGRQAPRDVADGRAGPVRLRQRGRGGGVRRAVRALDHPGTGRAPVRGRRDRLLAEVPEAVTEATLKQYRHSSAVTEPLEFPDRGWREVADVRLDRLGKQAAQSATSARPRTRAAPTRRGGGRGPRAGWSWCPWGFPSPGPQDDRTHTRPR